MSLFLFNQIREKNNKINNIRLDLGDQPTIILFNFNLD